MTGDNWVEVMMRDMLLLEGTGGTLGLVVASLFYVVFFFFAQFIVVNLFIAVILESFDIEAAARSSNRGLGIKAQYDMSKVRTKIKEGVWSSMTMMTGGKDRGGENRVHPGVLGDNANGLAGHVERMQEVEGRAVMLSMVEHRSSEELYTDLVELEMGRPSLSETARVCSGVDVSAVFGGTVGVNFRFVRSSTEVRSLSKALDSKEEKVPVQRERVIFFLDPSSPVAQLVIAIADHPLFDNLVGLAIVFSCIFLAIDSPDPAIQSSVALTQDQLDTGNIICVAVFTFEFVIRGLSDGIIFTRRAYFRSA